VDITMPTTERTETDEPNNALQARELKQNYVGGRIEHGGCDVMIVFSSQPGFRNPV
jgi:hypothetical protein